MPTRTRHRVVVYGLNHRDVLVELKVLQRPTALLAAQAAADLAAGPRGALAYTVELDAEDAEVPPAVVIAGFGYVPAL